MSNLTIPFFGINRQYNFLRQEILDVTDEVLRTGQVMSGNYTAEFENWLAKKNHSKYAITCHSGTQALEIIAHYIKKVLIVNDTPRALIPAMTFKATANAFINAGWDIEFVDTDHYAIMDYGKIDESNLPDVIVGVGLYGAAIEDALDMRKIAKRLALTSPPGTMFVEDAAQHWLSNNCRRIGLAAAISFDPTKNFNNYANGGAIVTNDHDLFSFAQAYRQNGTPQGIWYGTNSRMGEVDCAQLMVKSKYIDSWQERRRHIAEYWSNRLSKAEVRCLIDKNNIANHCYHKFVIEVDDRDQLKAHLAQKRIEARVHYSTPLHEEGHFRQYPGPYLLCNASALCRRVLSLPIYPELSDLEVEYIIDQILDFYEEKHN